MNGDVRSRRVVSWFFGDGVTLLHQIPEHLGLEPFKPTPIDPILTNPVMMRSSGGAIGFRITRRLTRRFAAEFTVDSSDRAPAMTAGASDAILRATQQFRAFWRFAFPSFQRGAPTDALHFLRDEILSTSEIETGRSGRQTLATAALRITLASAGGFHPYLTAGGGVGFDDVTPATIRLNGLYLVRAITSVPPGNNTVVLGPFDESDSVAVRYELDDRFPVGIVGGGILFDLPKRQGFRFDIRIIISPDTATTRLSATPVVRLGGLPAFDFVLGNDANAGVVFSNHTGASSSLSGDPVVDFTTRSGGTNVQTFVTFGYVVRF